MTQICLPHFAGGGEPTGLSLVGEEGPELFIPHTPGTIVPNHALSNLGGTTTNVIDARGTDPAMVHEAVQRGMAQVYAQATHDVQHQMADRSRRVPR